jgi:hypothetical protein
MRLARLRRRQDGWRPALELWRLELDLTTSTIRRIRARIELAKLYEHRTKQIELALGHSSTALDEIQTANLRGFFALTIPALEKRILRLTPKEKGCEHTLTARHPTQ